MRTLALCTLLTLVLVPTVGGLDLARSVEPGRMMEQRDDRSVYLVYYWRARPGQFAAYSEYIRKVAEPIDESARQAGVFQEVRTYTQAITTGAPGADWTHMRVFRLESFASWDAFSRGLDEATLRVFPDEAERRRLMGGSSELRDLVRQEIWRDFR